jgi:AcrR family transcriptional regulator
MGQRLSAETQKPKIVQGFYQTILDEGFEGASIAKIAGRIDMKPTLIIHYFGTKENLTLALVDYVIEVYARLLKKFRLKHDDPEDRIRAVLDAIWSRAYYEKVHASVAFSVLSASFRNDRIKKKIKVLYQLFKINMIRDIEALNAIGLTSIGDVEKTAEVLMSMIEGYRHFRSFYVKAKDVPDYNRHMISAALSILGLPENKESSSASDGATQDIHLQAANDYSRIGKTG